MASMVFLIPGIGETSRLNVTAAGAGDGRVAIDMTEAYTHCARCMLRSKLWTAVPDALPDAPADGPLPAPGVAAFLATAPLPVISSRDGDERADTLRNLMTCPGRFAGRSASRQRRGPAPQRHRAGQHRPGTARDDGAARQAAAPGAFTRRAMDAPYRSALRDEGY
ncbi:hypothetical protein LUW76_00505 [Actinomadura madurae]|uniref:hypothetical protein n=1 Tax=Actinomadura madurae TaxID=1993 RepID=UPI002025CA0D|nr:hypothetical protein [Actinomadura madurae]URM92945.1 hypothetical protein LUW76_00505 [Actinomadura madurae]